MATAWFRFWLWYDKHFTKTLLVTWLLLMTQIPHWVWGGDLLLNIGIVSRQSILTDFILYGVDWLELPLVVNVTMQVYSKYAHQLSKAFKHK